MNDCCEIPNILQPIFEKEWIPCDYSKLSEIRAFGYDLQQLQFDKNLFSLQSAKEYANNLKSMKVSPSIADSERLLATYHNPKDFQSLHLIDWDQNGIRAVIGKPNADEKSNNKT